MKKLINKHLTTLKTTPKTLLLVYVIVYFLWGLGMNRFGAEMEIARFTYWWQVITCYILYMVPISILLREYKFFEQYAYGLVAMGILEFLGYWLKTSYAYPDNVLDHFFNPQNFSLGMALFFALYFPAGNWFVNKVHSVIIPQKTE
ncbi:hypothetical protein U6A24_01090 [Aquimarina gracilis]|uniref:Uncharacterized protein n=1 Tax=Aquimarina gracilis TaxID=874422 RepID=A0ABU5ZRP0_9FLAO|nr:hypothetical protein [Aquimarina gracilis]MEB3344032.1 hypothetical protein [Aquimarina gracilis]